jgi:hypothetical protein
MPFMSAADPRRSYATLPSHASNEMASPSLGRTRRHLFQHCLWWRAYCRGPARGNSRLPSLLQESGKLAAQTDQGSRSKRGDGSSSGIPTIFTMVIIARKSGSLRKFRRHLPNRDSDPIPGPEYFPAPACRICESRDIGVHMRTFRHLSPQWFVLRGLRIGQNWNDRLGSGSNGGALTIRSGGPNSRRGRGGGEMLGFP